MRFLSYCACLSLLAGCGDDKLGRALKRVVAGQITDQVTSCPAPPGLSMLGTDTVRITARVHDAADRTKTAALCDVSIKEGDLSGQPVFGYPLGNLGGDVKVDL